MKTIISNMFSSTDKIDEEYVLSNIMVTDDDMQCLLSYETPLPKKILFYACYIDLNRIKGKEFLKFIKKYSLKGCEIYLSNSFKLGKEIRKTIGAENIVYNESFIETYLKRNNNSLNNIKNEYIRKLNTRNLDLSKVDLNFNTDFFQLVKEKKLEDVILPPIDFKRFDISDVEFLDCKFSEGTIFSYNFFQKIKNKKIIGCTLPSLDFNSVNVDDVTFMFVRFSKHTIFPSDPNFFKRFNMLYACSLPSYDYKPYALNDVKMNYCLFKENSELPLTLSLTNENVSNTYPKSFTNVLHIAPIRNLNYDEIMLRYGKYLSEQQKVIIYFKLKK